MSRVIDTNIIEIEDMSQAPTALCRRTTAVLGLEAVDEHTQRDVTTEVVTYAIKTGASVQEQDRRAIDEALRMTRNLWGLFYPEQREDYKRYLFTYSTLTTWSEGMLLKSRGLLIGSYIGADGKLRRLYVVEGGDRIAVTVGRKARRIRTMYFVRKYWSDLHNRITQTWDRFIIAWTRASEYGMI